MDKIPDIDEHLIDRLRQGEQIESTDENKNGILIAIDRYFDRQNREAQNAVKRRVSITLDHNNNKAYIAIGANNYPSDINGENYSLEQGINGIWTNIESK